MANPALVTCALDTWVLVASGVTAGVIYNMAPNVQLMQTYRMANDDAPTSDDDSVPAFNSENDPLIISASAAIDVYLKAVGVEGLVRVDV